MINLLIMKKMKEVKDQIYSYIRKISWELGVAMTTRVTHQRWDAWDSWDISAGPMNFAPRWRTVVVPS